MSDLSIQKLYDDIEKEQCFSDLSAAENFELKQQVHSKNLEIQKLTAQFDSLQTEHDELLAKLRDATTELEEEKRARERGLLDIIAQESFINYQRDVNEGLEKDNQKILEDNDELCFQLEKLKAILSDDKRSNLHLLLEAEKPLDEDAVEENTDDNLHLLEDIVEEDEERQNNIQSVQENSSEEAANEKDCL